MVFARVAIRVELKLMFILQAQLGEVFSWGLSDGFLRAQIDVHTSGGLHPIIATVVRGLMLFIIFRILNQFATKKAKV